MLSSFSLEGKVAPRGTACPPAPNGWHMTTMHGVCVHCNQTVT